MISDRPTGSASSLYKRLPNFHLQPQLTVSSNSLTTTPSLGSATWMSNRHLKCNMAETEFLILPPKCFSTQAGSVDSSFFSLQFRSNPQAMPTGATVFSPPHCHRSSPGCSGLLTGRSLPPGACDNLTCSFLPSLPNPRISPIEEKQRVTFKIQNQSCRPP